MAKWLILAGLWLGASNAEAYVPPGGFIIGKMADKRAALNLNDVEAQMQTAWAGAGDPVDEKLQIKRPGRLRWSRSEGEWAYIAKEGEVAEVDARGNVTRRHVDVEPIVDLLVPRAQNAE